MGLHFARPSTITIKKFLVFFIFFANIIVIFWLWWSKSHYYIQNPADGNLIIALGRITGLLAEYFILTQLILIGRIRPIEHLWGFDRLNKLHRFIGYSVVTFLLIHPLLLTVGYAQSYGVSYLSQFGDFLANKNGVFLSFFSVVLFIFVIFISIAIVRRKLRYETWYFTHLLTYLAIGLAVKHQLGTGDLQGGWPLYYWYVLNFGVFGLMLTYRFVRPLVRFAYHRFIVEKVVQETYDTWSIYISGKNMEHFIFEAGQYINITVLRKDMWYTHPFSFSAAYNGNSIRLTIKALGDYTKKIATLQPGTHVIVDGPLGLFTEERADREKFLFIAGGIGITPIRAMLETLAFEKKDAILLYGNKSERDITFKQELDAIHEYAPTIVVRHILGTPTPGYESGFIDKEKIVRLAPDFYTREVYLCGPPVMMNLMVGHLKGLGFDAHHIHYEKFSF